MDSLISYTTIRYFDWSTYVVLLPSASRPLNNCWSNALPLASVGNVRLRRSFSLQVWSRSTDLDWPCPHINWTGRISCGVMRSVKCPIALRGELERFQCNLPRFHIARNPILWKPENWAKVAAAGFPGPTIEYYLTRHCSTDPGFCFSQHSIHDVRSRWYTHPTGSSTLEKIDHKAVFTMLRHARYSILFQGDPFIHCDLIGSRLYEKCPKPFVRFWVMIGCLSKNILKWKQCWNEPKHN